MNDPHLQALRQALAQQQQGRLAEAENGLRQVLTLAPRNAMAWQLLGLLLAQTGRLPEGLAALRQSIEHNPQDAGAHNNLAKALMNAGDAQGALRACEQALALDPVLASAYATRALLLAQAGRAALAQADVERALTIDPRQPAAQALRRYLATLPIASTAPAWQGVDDPVFRIGMELLKQGRHEAAAQAFERVAVGSPHHARARGNLLQCRLHLCDWRGRAELLSEVEALTLQGEQCMQPFALLAASDRPEVHRAAARIEGHIPPLDSPPAQAHPPPPVNGRIRVAYCSADFHEHATAYLMAELFELHDRRDFEWIAVSFGPDDASPMRARLVRAFDRFIYARDWSEERIAQWLRDEQVDIAVDLKGHTRDHRMGLFRRRPAPIQVNYLGYPGTSGLECFDYILGDATVTPMADAPHYTERIVQLPHSYMVNDRQRAIATDTPSRADENLPPQGFVFACFNNLYKLTPEVFAVWLRLLSQVPDSVLWLLGEAPAVQERLRALALAQGVAPSRLVFTERRPLDRHLARHRLADLFLDTQPYNAHTTASDALWAGLPVLTCQGRSFAARVAASLLKAAGLPELVTHSLADYEARALALATRPGELAALRERLRRDGPGSPLFDTPRFARGIESAYHTMVDRWRQGLPPAPFEVADPH